MVRHVCTLGYDRFGAAFFGARIIVYLHFDFELKASVSPLVGRKWHFTSSSHTGTCHTRMKQLHTCTAAPSHVDNSQTRSWLVHAPPSHRPGGMASDREAAVAVAACTSVGRQRDLSRGLDESRRAPTPAWSTHATMMVGPRTETWQAWNGRAPPRNRGAGRLGVRPPKGWRLGGPARRGSPAGVAA